MVFEKSAGDRYFTTIDFTKDYWQIPVADADIHKTAFATHDGTFEFVKMPFTMVNSSATFRMVNFSATFRMVNSSAKFRMVNSSATFVRAMRKTRKLLNGLTMLKPILTHDLLKIRPYNLHSNALFLEADFSL